MKKLKEAETNYWDKIALLPKNLTWNQIWDEKERIAREVLTNI